MSAEIRNVDKLLRKLTIIPERLRQAIKDAMAEQADEVVAMMKRLVPVDQGDLRDSIGWRWGNTAPKGAMKVASVSSEQRSDLTITIYAGSAKAFYARWVEFGTVKMRARPFFFVSWRASRKKTRRRVNKAVRDAARQVSGS